MSGNGAGIFIRRTHMKIRPAMHVPARVASEVEAGLARPPCADHRTGEAERRWQEGAAWVSAASADPPVKVNCLELMNVLSIGACAHLGGCFLVRGYRCWLRWRCSWGGLRRWSGLLTICARGIASI